MNRKQIICRKRVGQAKFGEGSLQACGVAGIVDELAADDGSDLINGVGEKEAAVKN